MQTHSSTTPLRLGAVALGLATLIAPIQFAISDPRRGVDPPQAYGSPQFVVAHLLGTASFILLIFGTLALYGYLRSSRREGLALLGMVVTLVGIGVFLPAYGFLFIVSPALAQLALQGQKEASAVITTIAITPGVITLVAGSVLIAFGAIIFSIAIWRSNTLPKWAGILYAVGLLAIVFHVQLPQVGDILAGLLMAIGGVWLAWDIWREAPVTVREVAAASMVQ
ncbi:MAG: hypothetical protein NVSMB27_16000 [Ktedonobacteraceae bacterium]